MRYHIRPNLPPDMRWRNLKFHFFVTRDICAVTLAVQLVREGRGDEWRGGEERKGKGGEVVEGEGLYRREGILEAP